jgi:hypothetical protein
MSSSLRINSRCRYELCDKTFIISPDANLKDFLYCCDGHHKKDYELRENGLRHPGIPLITPKEISPSEFRRRRKLLERLHF